MCRNGCAIGSSDWHPLFYEEKDLHKQKNYDKIELKKLNIVEKEIDKTIINYFIENSMHCHQIESTGKAHPARPSWTQSLPAGPGKAQLLTTQAIQTQYKSSHGLHRPSRQRPGPDVAHKGQPGPILNQPSQAEPLKG